MVHWRPPSGPLPDAYPPQVLNILVCTAISPGARLTAVAWLTRGVVNGPARDGRGETLRVGILLDGMVVNRWIASVLQEIASAPFCDLVLFVLNVEPRTRRSFLRRVWKSRHYLLFKLYNLVDVRVYGRPDDAFSVVDLSGAYGAVPRLGVEPLTPRPFEHRFDAGAIESIRHYHLDVLLRFGFNIIRGEILQAARFGVWSFHHGDNTQYRGGPAFYWEMAEGDPVSGTILQRLTDELDGGQVLYRSWSATDRVSLRRGSNPAYWKSAHFVIRCLRDIHERGWTFVASRPDPSADVAYEKPIYRVPTNRQALRFLLRIGTGVTARRLRRLCYQSQWLILYRRAARSIVGTFEHAGSDIAPAFPSRDDSGLAMAGPPFRAIAPPKDRFYADPFVISDSSNTYLVFEEYRGATRKGFISYMAAEDEHQVKTALERPYHLSYPFTFSRDGRWYMIPESLERRTIELYRAERTPDRWRFDRILISGISAVDPTLFHDGERFWLFACVAEHGASNSEELCLFYATDLGDSWTPHPLNPVVSDVRRARPAGALFKIGDHVIRPGQDCSGKYGSAIVFHRIDELSVDNFRERVVDRLDGASIRGMVAAHTYNFASGFEVIDAVRRFPRFLPRRRS